MCRSTNRQPEPEVWFRIVHIAQEGHNGGSVAAYREQTVEIALGPKGAFENANVGALIRRAPDARVVCAMPRLCGNPKPAKEPRTPRVVELLHKAIEWQTLLESGRIASHAEIARQEGITRTRVTQILGLLRLAPEIQEKVLNLPASLHRCPVTERMLRHWSDHG